MASVDFKKIKASERYYTYSICRHNDKFLREKQTHSNEHINRDISKLNSQKFNYADTKKRIDKKLKELELTNTNKRKDRVEFFALCVTPPQNMFDENMQRAFLKDALKIIYDFCNEFSINKNNVINAWLHADEIHEYFDDNQYKMSKIHLHILSSCEMNGSLNAKQFSSKERLLEINRKIDVMCQEKYNMQFITNNNDVRKKKVEELKLESLIQENEQKENELKLKENELQVKNNEINKLQALYQKLYEKALALMKKIKEKENILKEYTELQDILEKI